MQRYSIFSLARNALTHHRNWAPAWRSPPLKDAYDVIIIGAGGHGLATAYYLAKNHGITDVAVLEHGWLGGGNVARNTVTIRHPLSAFIPGAGRWLDMPARPLPGDSFMPRYQQPSEGASERFVVSPGREEDGIFHMPTGQSGHPLSPFYRAGHEAWETGEPTPFLPGETVHTLRLVPALP